MLDGEGMPTVGNPFVKGRLFIIFKVKTRMGDARIICAVTREIFVLALFRRCSMHEAIIACDFNYGA